MLLRRPDVYYYILTHADAAYEHPYIDIFLYGNRFDDNVSAFNDFEAVSLWPIPIFYLPVCRRGPT